MQIIHHLTIDMARQLPIVPLAAVQNDSNTRAVEVSLLENGTPWKVPEGVTAAVAFRKPDKTKGLYDQLPDGYTAVTIAGSTVTAILAPQVLTCAGEVSAAVVFHDADLNQLATFPFVLRVAANPAAGQQVSNDYYQYSTMEQISEAVESALVSMEESKQDFLTKAEEALAVIHDTATEDAPAIVCDAFGKVFSVSDASNRPLQCLSLYGKTTQDGTPIPSAPVNLETVGTSGAISVTVTGKNLIDSTGISSTSVTAKYYPVTVNAGSYKLTMFNPDGTTDGLPVNAQYSASFLDADGNIIVSNVQKGVTVPAEAVSRITQLKVNLDGKAYTGSHDTICGQLETGLEATAYEPYKGQTLTASTPNGLPGIPVGSGGNYTDENGQAWACDEIDFVRGVYIKRLDTKVFDGSADEPWNYGDSYINYPNSSTLYARIWMPLSGIGAASDSFALCDKLGNYGVGADYAPKHGAELWTNYTNFHVLPGKDYPASENSVDTMRKWLADNPITVLYEMETPIEMPLSAEELAQYAALHCNKPNTTVFNDSGAGMKLSYVADTKTYIDQKIAAISAVMLNA